MTNVSRRRFLARLTASACALGAGLTEAEARAPKTFRAAFLTILVADLSMSLDNVLAVAGAAREHPAVLVAVAILCYALYRCFKRAGWL